MKYIAYGSNMVREQMAVRCPDAKLVGVGYLPDHQLEFYLHATVERSQIIGGRGSAPSRLSAAVHVPVAVWEISAADEHWLDLYEGYPNYYTKAERTVRMADGSGISGMIYLMKHIRRAPPTRAYYNAIANAYNELGLGFEIELVLEPALMRALARGDKR